MAMMDIQLARKDLYQATCITGRGLGLLPPTDKKKCHKVVVGADNGILTCFRLKKGEAQEEFQTTNLDYPVSCLLIGGPLDKRDRVFFTSAQTIRGVNKKGKEFFRFNTDGAETLKGLWVVDNKIWTSGEYTFNHYVEVKDAGYYMSRDRINDLLIAPILSNADMNAILACQDRHIRVLDGKKLYFEAFVDGAVNILTAFKDPEEDKAEDKTEILFGTDNGIVGKMVVDAKSIRPDWSFPNVGNFGGISSIATADLTRKGSEDIIVGRDDGQLQVLSVDAQGEVTEVFSKSVNECIQGVKVGRVCTTNFDEIVIATYSGKVLSFTTEHLATGATTGEQAFAPAQRIEEKVLTETPLPGPSAAPTAKDEPKKISTKKKVASFFGLGGKKDKDDDEKKDKDKPATSSQSGAAAPAESKSEFVKGLIVDRAGGGLENIVGGPENEARSDPKERANKIAAITKEIDKLRDKLDKEKTDFHKVSKDAVPVSTRSKVKNHMILDPEIATYKLTLEMEMPIEMVALQSSIALTLLDPGPSVPSFAEPDLANGNMFLATLRIQGNTNRLQVSIMTQEGQSGTLNAFVFTKVSPKVCHLVENKILPLSLHRSVPIPKELDPAEPYCQVSMQGSFGLAQMHSWITTCFPSMPPKVPEGDSVRFDFESTYTHARVSVQYSKGEATFRSCNLSALATIKDLVSKAAASSKVKLDVKPPPVIDENAVTRMLTLLHPKLHKLLKLKEDVRFIEALHELSNGTGDDSAHSFLSPDLQNVLKRADELRAEHTNNAKHISFLEHVLEQLFIDRFKFRSINVKHRVSEVHALVDKYSWEALLTLFAVTATPTPAS